MFLVAFCYVYGLYFFISWLHTFLVRGRGFSEGALLLSTAPGSAWRLWKRLRRLRE